ncbi:MAG TPA: hypothetical protein VLW85_25045 [Myxococcales bacterium]|nr:hypothetical protein [Myxococcales bacterium]
MRALAAALLAATAALADQPPQERVFQLRVHLLSNDQRVELRRGDSDAAICTAPCGTTIALRAGDEFRLAGPELAPSDAFTFYPRDGDLTLKVTARPQKPRTISKGVIIAGAAVFLLSGIVADVGIAKAQNDCGAGVDYSNCWNGAITAGLIGTGIGVVTAVAGIIALVSNPPTSWERVSQ